MSEGKIPETNTLLTHYKVEKTCTKEFSFLFKIFQFMIWSSEEQFFCVFTVQSYLLFQAHNRIIFFEFKICVQLLVNYKICKFLEFL